MKNYLKPELAINILAGKQPISSGLSTWLGESGVENANDISIVTFSVES